MMPEIALNVLDIAQNSVRAEASLIQISVDVDEAADTLTITIEDNGCGIPKDLRKHVFEPFFTTKKDGKGTGIGLTVVKRMVEEHGGWIQVQSEEEKGTTFIMNFPRVDDSE